MKSCLKPFILILFTAFTFTGCDLLDKADDVTFDEVIEVDWVADENLDGTDVPYVHLEDVDLRDNPEIEKYANKIKEIKVTKITYSVVDYNAEPHGDAVYFNNGTASFSAAGSSTPLVVVPYAAAATGVNLQAASAETELDIDADGLTDIANAFKDDLQLSMESEGTLTKVPVSFRVISKFYVTITANALD